MTYNMTALQQSSTFYGLLSYASDASGGLLTGLFMVAICFVMIMSLKKYGLDSAILTSSFVCFILSLFLRYADLINFMYVIAFLAAMVFMGLYMFVVNRE